MTQTGQMDLYIRYWDEVTDRVLTQYMVSQFLGHAAAIDLLDAFKSEIKQVNCKRLAQVSMDRPSVNWAFLDQLKQSLERNDLVILDIGSCSLHIVHGAFRTDEKASDFGIGHLLTSLYYLFHDSPA